MDADLKNLESKLAQLIECCHTLYSENTALHQALAQAESDNARLRQNADAVGARLDAIIERLPGETA